MTTTYKNAGVDIDAGDALVDRILSAASRTKRKEVISSLGGFAGYFSLGHRDFKNPVLVASTDGVGTKLRIAIDMKRFNTIGHDLVAMCVNDLVCCGAEPLFFLDYYATGKLNVEEAAQVIESMGTALESINCSLIGGETAEMPGMYKAGDFDLAGFAVGVVDKDKIVEGTSVQIGHSLIGLHSSGFHSNGYSLVRRIIEDKNLSLDQGYHIESGKSLGDLLIEPTHLYVNPALRLLKEFDVRAMAHITGGGIVENLPRVMPQSCQAIIQKQSIPTPKVMRFIQEQGKIPEDEMWRVFNMGIGFILIVPKNIETAIIHQLDAMNFNASVIGEIVEKEKPDSPSIVLA